MISLQKTVIAKLPLMLEVDTSIPNLGDGTSDYATNPLTSNTHIERESSKNLTTTFIDIANGTSFSTVTTPQYPTYPTGARPPNLHGARIKMKLTIRFQITCGSLMRNPPGFVTDFYFQLEGKITGIYMNLGWPGFLHIYLTSSNCGSRYIRSNNGILESDAMTAQERFNDAEQQLLLSYETFHDFQQMVVNGNNITDDLINDTAADLLTLQVHNITVDQEYVDTLKNELKIGTDIVKKISGNYCYNYEDTQVCAVYEYCNFTTSGTGSAVYCLHKCAQDPCKSDFFMATDSRCYVQSDQPYSQNCGCASDYLTFYNGYHCIDARWIIGFSVGGACLVILVFLSVIASQAARRRKQKQDDLKYLMEKYSNIDAFDTGHLTNFGHDGQISDRISMGNSPGSISDHTPATVAAAVVATTTSLSDTARVEEVSNRESASFSSPAANPSSRNVTPTPAGYDDVTARVGATDSQGSAAELVPPSQATSRNEAKPNRHSWEAGRRDDGPRDWYSAKSALTLSSANLRFYKDMLQTEFKDFRPNLSGIDTQKRISIPKVERQSLAYLNAHSDGNYGDFSL